MTSIFFTVERDGKEIECEITGSYQGADPDCGIMGGYFEDIVCTSLETREDIELTELEEERANEELTEAHESDNWDYE
jgi:hypothetical protein